ncbi:MAG TPA: NAD-dependent epimerase/dehydratase family protein [Geminicoccaceae bacterium]|nr:NAD-dependent epimerase/dehydratase family protein [Geminicoccaceae bacterium]
MRILITGAAGYVGWVLVDALQALDGVSRIIGVDLRPRPDRLRDNDKVAWIQADVSTDGWQAAARAHRPDAVVHLAFQIRQLYGRKQKIQRRWNIDGARKAFAFALGEPSVRRLVHFSTITAYGAQAGNSLAARFRETDLLRERDYLYGSHKREIEGLLEQAYAAADRTTQVVVLRCASISGPLGRLKLGRFGIVSTLTSLFPFLPCGRADFGRQYLHEDDVADIVATLLTAPPRRGYDVFNAAPEDYLAAGDLAALLRKRMAIVPQPLLRGLFPLCWHASRGRVPTPPGAWKFVTFPIAVDGSALTRAYGYRYRFTSTEALTARSGRHLAEIDATTIAAAPAAIVPRSGVREV